MQLVSDTCVVYVSAVAQGLRGPGAHTRGPPTVRPPPSTSCKRPGCTEGPCTHTPVHFPHSPSPTPRLGLQGRHCDGPLWPADATHGVGARRASVARGNDPPEVRPMGTCHPCSTSWAHTAHPLHFLSRPSTDVAAWVFPTGIAGRPSRTVPSATSSLPMASFLLGAPWIWASRCVPSPRTAPPRRHPFQAYELQPSHLGGQGHISSKHDASQGRQYPPYHQSTPAHRPLTRCLCPHTPQVGLGTDVAGGYSPSMLSAVRSAVLASRVLEDGTDRYVHGAPVGQGAGAGGEGGGKGPEVRRGR
jgi:hypothetical protein